MKKNYLLFLFLLTSLTQIFGQSEGNWKNEVLPKKIYYNKGDTLTLLYEYYNDPEFISNFVILSDIPKTEIVSFLRTSDFELVDKMQYDIQPQKTKKNYDSQILYFDKKVTFRQKIILKAPTTLISCNIAYSVIHSQNNSFKTFTKNFNIKI